MLWCKLRVANTSALQLLVGILGDVRSVKELASFVYFGKNQLTLINWGPIFEKSYDKLTKYL